MTKLLRAAAAALSFSVATNAAAQGLHAPQGNELYVDCAQSMPTCSTYLLGVWDGLVEAGYPLCASGTVTAGQLRLVFLKFARDNPAVLAQSEGDTAFAAIALAFPCGKRS